MKNGKWRAVLSAGADPVTGKRSRPSKVFDTKPEAQQWLAEQQAARGLNRSAAPARWTLAEWCTQWLRTLKLEREHGTWRGAESRVRLYILPHLGSVKLSNLSRLVVDSWRHKLASLPNVSDAQQHRAAKVLRQLCGAAVEAGYLPTNPVPVLAKPKGVRRAKINPFTRDEARAFLTAAAGSRFEALWWLALDSGARPSELLALHWSDVNLDRGTIHIEKSVEFRDGGHHFKDPKTPASVRTVPIAPITVAKLRGQIEILTHGRRYEPPGRYSPAGLLFPSTRGSGPITASYMNSAFHRVRNRAKLAARRMYELRHTSATLLLAAGVSLRVVADRLGHEDPGVTLRFYAGSLPAEQEAARRATAEIYGV